MTDLNDVSNGLATLIWHVKELPLNDDEKKKLIDHINEIDELVWEVDNEDET